MRRLRLIVPAFVVGVAVAATATALATRAGGVLVGAGGSATFTGTGWTCSNLGSSLVCRHGSSRPYLTLANRHAGSFIVIVHPSSGKTGAPSKSRQRGESIPDYIFSSPPR